MNMGYLDGNEFHVEAKDRGVAVWSNDELKRFLMLSKEDATTLGEELIYHASFVQEKHEPNGSFSCPICGLDTPHHHPHNLIK